MQPLGRSSKRRAGSCRYTGTASVLACLTCWALATFSDPGRVTAASHAAWAARDPPGNHLFPEKQCATCLWRRPGRSKHCGLCGACIARHDHHCAWINNCVGAYNLRWFLAFVASNCAVAAYGAVLGAAAVVGHLWDRGLADALYADPKTGKPELIRRNPGLVISIIARSFPVQLLLIVGLALVGAVMAAFTSYHCWGVHAGVTGTERHKLAELQRSLALQARATDRDGDSADGKLWTWRARRLAVPALPEFPYKQPAWQNWLEAFFPATIEPAALERQWTRRTVRSKSKQQ